MRMQAHFQTHTRITDTGTVRLVPPNRRLRRAWGVAGPHALLADAPGV